MSKPEDKRRKARSDYVYRRMTGTTIAAIHRISPSTFARWKKSAKAQGDDWDIARSASIIAGEGVEAVVSSVVEDFMIMAQSLIDEIKNNTIPMEQKIKHLTSLADGMTKMTSAAGKLAPRISELGVAQDVVSQMLDFVRAEFPHHSAAILEILEPFGDMLTARFAS